MYTRETLVLSEGETITGEFGCNPNDRNPRDLDLAIDYEVQGQVKIAESLKFKMFVKLV